MVGLGNQRIRRGAMCIKISSILSVKHTAELSRTCHHPLVGFPQKFFYGTAIRWQQHSIFITCPYDTYKLSGAPSKSINIYVVTMNGFIMKGQPSNVKI
jgi:hypothetical protein